MTIFWLRNIKKKIYYVMGYFFLIGSVLLSCFTSLDFAFPLSSLDSGDPITG